MAVRFGTEVVPLDDCEAAYDRLREGTVLRSVTRIAQ